MGLERSALVVVCAALAALGCSAAGGAQGAPDASTSDKDGAADAATPFTLEAMRAASVAYNTKYCNAAAQCDPELFEVYWGDVATCIDADAGAADLAVWFPYGSTLTPDVLTACAKALDLSTCQKYALFAYEYQVPSAWPSACSAISYGTLPAGAACATNGIFTAPLWNQCRSGRCVSTGGPCGTCAAEALPVGATCNGPIYCASGLGCGLGTCAPYGEIGDPCSGPAQCHTYLECMGGKCVAPPADGTCDPAYGCPIVPQLRNCGAMTHKCLPSVAGHGQPCGYRANAVFPIECAYPDICADSTAAGVTDGGADAGGAAVCVPPPSLGEPCFFNGLDTGCPRGGLRSLACVDNACIQQSAAECSSPGALP